MKAERPPERAPGSPPRQGTSAIVPQGADRQLEASRQHLVEQSQDAMYDAGARFGATWIATRSAQRVVGEFIEHALGEVRGRLHRRHGSGRGSTTR